MIDINLILIFILFNFPILIFFNWIILKFNIYDQNDNLRKIHSHPVSLFGGTIILYNFLICLILQFFSDYYFFNDNFFNNNREIFSFVFGCITFYLVGLFDDKYVFDSNKKFIISFFLVYLILSLDVSLIIKEISFQNYKTIELYGFSKPFTILCFLLFLNALNMFDGINLQNGLYSIILFVIFILKGININLNFFLLFSLILFLYFNYRNKCFLGDSGSNILFFIISYTVVKNYNLNNNFQIEEIFILMFLPGLDMFRLFLLRLIKGSNPFKADNRHIHHLILKLLKNKTNTALTIFFANLLIIILYYFIDQKLIYCFAVTILYFLSIYFIYKKKVR